MNGFENYLRRRFRLVDAVDRVTCKNVLKGMKISSVLKGRTSVRQYNRYSLWSFCRVFQQQNYFYNTTQL